MCLRTEGCRDFRFLRTATVQPVTCNVNDPEPPSLHRNSCSFRLYSITSSEDASNVDGIGWLLVECVAKLASIASELP